MARSNQSRRRPRSAFTSGGRAVARSRLGCGRRPQEERFPCPCPPMDEQISVARDDQGSLRPRRLGGTTRRKAPASGLRPTVRFAVASALTLAWVGFSVWVSDPWRDELGDAIGPVMAWVIPIFLAYIPGLVIGFMIFTLLITRYQELPLAPPRGDWPEARVAVGDDPCGGVERKRDDRPHARTDRRTLVPRSSRGRRRRQQLDRRHRTPRGRSGCSPAGSTTDVFSR